MSKANGGRKRRSVAKTAKRYRKELDMNRGNVRAAEAKGHRFTPDAQYCPKCQTAAHVKSEASRL